MDSEELAYKIGYLLGRMQGNKLTKEQMAKLLERKPDLFPTEKELEYILECEEMLKKMKNV